MRDNIFLQTTVLRKFSKIHEIFLGKTVVVIGIGLIASLTACTNVQATEIEATTPTVSASVIKEAVIPTEQTVTIEVVATQTLEATEIVPTEEVAPVEAPEGFSVGEYGMLRDPSTGKELIEFNPKVDWAKFREDLIKGIWQYNVDWYKYTGEKNDAVNYATADEFYNAAILGKEFSAIGVPIRKNIDWNDFDMTIFGNKAGRDTKTSHLGIKLVSCRLDEIKIQILEPSTFPEVVGNDSWLDPNNESFITIPAPMSIYQSYAQETSYFSVSDLGELILSLGAFNLLGIDAIPPEFIVGSFDTKIGPMADIALSDNLDRLISVLQNSKIGQHDYKDKSGNIYKKVGISQIDQAIIEEGIQYFKLRDN